MTSRVSRRQLVAAALATPAALAAPRIARAQGAWPARPVRMIVPFAAGGGTDVLARILANDLSTRLGQTVLVENRGGSGGNLGMEAAVRAAPDGYTLLMGTNGPMAVNRHLYRGMNFDPAKDLLPITMAFRIEQTLIVHPSLPVRNVAELVALAKSKPGELTYGSAGTGSALHLAGALFVLRTGTNIIHVPYRGGGPAMNDLVAGNISMTFDSLPSSEPQIRAGRVRALAMCAAKRHHLLPDLPTMQEAGVPNYVAGAWGALFAPVGTPRPIIERVARVVGESLAAADVRQRLARSGGDAESSTPEELTRIVQTETEVWGQVVREANITVN